MENRQRSSFLCVLLTAWLAGTVVECGADSDSFPAKPRVKVQIFTQSDISSSITTFSTDNMLFAYFNSTFPNFKFLIKEMNAFLNESSALLQMYKNDMTALNNDILNEMVGRIESPQPEPPLVLLYPNNPDTSGQRIVLNCFVQQVFPPEVNIYFLRNDQPLPGPVNSSQYVFDDTWKFQIVKHVEIEPADEEIYSCVVEMGSSGRISVDWEPDKPHKPYDSTQIAICVTGFIVGTLGLITALVLFFYKWETEVYH